MNYAEVEGYYAIICSVIHNTAIEIIGKASKSKKQKAVPWWNKCGEANKERNDAFRKVKSTFAFCDLVRYKKAHATV